MVVDLNAFELRIHLLMRFLKVSEKLENNLNKLNLFARLNQTIRRLRVGQVKDRFGIFWHDGCSDFFIEVIKIKFYFRQKFRVLLIPGQRNNHGDKFQPE